MIVLFAIYVLSIIIHVFNNRKQITYKKNNILCFLLYLLLGISCFVWYFVIKVPTYIHPWYHYRNIALLLWSIPCGIEALLIK